MDDQQTKMVDEVDQKFAEAIMLMNRTSSGRPAEAQDRLVRLTRSFVERVISNLEAQAESDRVGSQRLAEQARRGKRVAASWPSRICPSRTGGGKRPIGSSLRSWWRPT